MRRSSLAALACAGLAACQPPTASVPPSGQPTAETTEPAKVAPATSAPPRAERQVPNPGRVLQDWAAAIERRDWTAVRALWGHAGADSGLSPKAFAARWDRLRSPRVTVKPGEQEGAAGSSFYTAAVTISDGARQTTAPVTLRRVNDVPGATAEQLRWHLEPGAVMPWVP